MLQTSLSQLLGEPYQRLYVHPNIKLVCIAGPIAHAHG